LKNLLTFFSILFFLNCFGQDERKLALVIGNSNYIIGELKNPTNDADLISETLDSIGFDVLLHANLETKKDFISAISEFVNKIPEYDVSFFYYAGHGVQIDNENFLLPTKEVYGTQMNVKDYGVSLQGILNYIGIENKDKINIVTIDACRDNPFEKFWNKDTSIKSSGLAKVNPPPGFITAFSTESGEVAPDGDGENSIYSKTLSKNLYISGIPIEQVFKDVRLDVLDLTNGLQKPIESNTLVGGKFIINKTELYSTQLELFNYLTDHLNHFYLQDIDTSLLKYYGDIISKYDNDNIYKVIIDLMVYIVAGNNEGFEDRYSEINLDSLDEEFKNGLIYLKLKSNLQWTQSVRCQLKGDTLGYNCKPYILENFEIFKKLIDLDPSQNIFWSNALLVNKIYDLWNIDGSIQVDMEYIFSDKLSRKFYSKIYYEYLNKFVNYLEEVAEVIDFKSMDKVKPEDEEDLIGLDYSEYVNDIERAFRYDFISIPKIIMTSLMKDAINLSPLDLEFKWKELYDEYPDSSNLILFDARKLYLSNNFNAAEKLLKEKDEIIGLDPETHIILYLISLNKNEYFSALQSLERAMTFLYDDSDNYHSNSYYIGNAVFQENNSYNNLDFHEERINIWDLHVFKAELLIKMDNFNFACTSYENAIDSLQSAAEFGDFYIRDCDRFVQISERILRNVPDDCKINAENRLDEFRRKVIMNAARCD
jgi:hypothetical protein